MNEIEEVSVLVVEDDDATAELERRGLVRSGAQVTLAQRVSDALDLLAEHDFSAVVLDYQLPDGDAWRVLEFARSRTPRVPVVLVTAMGNERVVAEAMQRGVAEYLRKTDVLCDELPRAVERIILNARTEERRRRSETLFQLISEHASDILEISDPAGVIKYVSPACFNVLGYQPQEMVGRRREEFVLPGEPSEHPSTRTQRRRRLWRFRHKNGEPVWLESEATVSLDAHTRAVSETISIHRDVTAQQQAESVLRASLHEKEVLLSEVHHRVKNNLQIVSSLLSLQASRSEDEALRRLFQESQNRIQSIALVHETLYRSHDLARVDFGRYTETLIDGLARSQNAAARGIAVRLDVEEVALPTDVAVTCGLITNELVTNAFKYAFPGGRPGTVHVEVRHGAQSQLSLTIGDDGLGLPENIDPFTASSVGLGLVTALARQIDAKLELVRAPGTTFRLVLGLATERPDGAPALMAAV